MEKLLIWGTGGNARSFLDDIDTSKAEVAAFVDNDVSRHGQSFMGSPIIPPSEVPNFDHSLIVVCSAFADDILEQALGLGIPRDRIKTSRRDLPFLMRRFGHPENPFLALDAEQAALMEDVYWRHIFEIVPGIKTNGDKPWTRDKLSYFEALDGAKGKTVLDIGAWDGPYSFEMERRGAVVTALDIQDPKRSGFHAAKTLLGSKARFVNGSVYDLDPETHGVYDIVLFLGVYYHLRNPFLAFERIHTVLRPGGLLVFEGAILDGAARVDAEGYWGQNTDLLAQCLDTPFCYFSKGKYETDWSNWSIPTAVCLRDWIEAAGFEVLALDKREQDARAYGAARKLGEFDHAEHALF